MIDKNKMTHFSDCAIYNGPAYEPGPCDCGVMAEMGRYAELHRLIVALKRAQEVQQVIDKNKTIVLQSEDQRRWHGCLRKQAFISVGSAHTAGRHQGMARGTFTAYLCRYCGQWHIAKKVVANG